MNPALAHNAYRWNNVVHNYVKSTLQDLMATLKKHRECFAIAKIVVGSGNTPLSVMALDADTFFDPVTDKVYARVGSTGGDKSTPQYPVTRETTFLDPRFLEKGAIHKLFREHACSVSS